MSHSLDNTGLSGTTTWRDPARPVAERVASLLSQLTLEEKIAQLGSVWLDAAADGGDRDGGVAPLTGSFTLTGLDRVVGADRVLDTPVAVHDLP